MKSNFLIYSMELQATQAQLETLVQEKHYLHAVRIITAAEKIINNHDLENVQALSTIREQLAKTKAFLKETLTAELSNHLYLKNRSAFNRIGKEAYVNHNTATLITKFGHYLALLLII